MKKRIITALFASIAIGTCAQEEKNEKNFYKHWSVELNIGQNRALRPFSSGYFTSKPNTYFNFNGVAHYDIGTRYMFSPLFGLKADLAYDVIKNQTGSGSLEFNLKQYRLGIQGVINFARLLKFETFTKKIGLLLRRTLTCELWHLISVHLSYYLCFTCFSTGQIGFGEI
jgi:OOP family OmpA-OmpF porin